MTRDTQSRIAYDLNGLFQIIVPVFNEEETLEQVLGYGKDNDYLKDIVFVDDASTDSSKQILLEWAKYEGIHAISLQKNCKKEGAIRAALEILEREHRLAPYTILLDSDSYIARSDTEEAINSQIERAIIYMQSRGVRGMAFQIDPTSDSENNIFSNVAFADYSAMQFDHWLVSKQQQLWVINGPGGIFETQRLLQILRSIEPDFETGDLLITVELMKQNQPIEFYPDISVMTFVPTTLKTYFSQRRRWERGTTKVLWNERKFYLRLFCKLSLLGLSTLIHLSLYIGLFTTMVLILLNAMEIDAVVYVVVYSVIFWFAISVFKGVWLTFRRPHFPFAWYCLCAVGNGIVWAFINTPARITGFTDACIQLIWTPRRVTVSMQVNIENIFWLPTDHVSLKAVE